MCDDPAHHHAAIGRLWPRPVEGEAWSPIPLEPVDQVTVTVLVDNSYDALLGPIGPARRASSKARVPVVTFESGMGSDGLVAEHGFSALVTVERKGTTHQILFDLGVSPNGLVENSRRLDIDLGDVEAIVCSHGHFDHTAGFEGLLRRLGRPNLPVVIHPEFWNRRRVSIGGREPVELPSTSRRALEGLGFEVIERRDPSFLLDGAVLITGEVDRATDFERGFAGHQAWRGGAWTDDPLILDDQALVVHVAGRGLVVLTGCGHAGIVNITRYARRLTGVSDVAAVIGGFHLGGPLFEPVIGPTVSQLTELAPQLVVAAHCTGWKASHQLAAALPDAYIPNSVGTSFVLASETAA